ncbi:multiple sugar transport system substrate-binding protein [Deinococcus metalli]|nr:sugar ABC transporter substrate-binding protein [Deinococcus metalli]MBB5378078.1 multiple sugar transport system substrate-binding protein [Deinococcus metalli]
MRRTLTIAAALTATLAASLAQAKNITVWVIDGTSERPYFLQLEKAFNAANSSKGITAKVTPIPNINDALKAGFLSKKLPDVIMLDGPNMANYVWSGQLAPLNPYLDKALLSDLLPAIKDQGTYSPDGKMYSISPYDSTVLLWGNKKYLKEAGVRIPTSVKDAWTLTEFQDALSKLSKVKGVTWPLDLKLNYSGEWLSYGFAPFLQSCGADLINRKTWQATGTVNSPAAIKILTTLQDWKKKNWIVPQSGGDNRFFGDKTAALVWVGNWMWRDHKAGLKDDLVLIPAPKFCGNKQASPNGGWSWAIPASSANKADAGTFINFAMSTNQVAQYADITGYIPARKSATPLSKVYGKGGEGELMAEQAAAIAVVRPVHPAYPVISKSFGDAVLNILNGADVKSELDKAADAIDKDIAANKGYPPFNKK